MGWLINRKQQKVEIYRQRKVVEVLSSLQTVSEENILPGFSLNLAQIW